LWYNYGLLRDGGISAQMTEVAEKIALVLDYVGVMAVGFSVKSRRVVVNEIAPRVHNTGHHTLDATYISQFEQHLRAITGLGHGSTELTSCGGMVNVLGAPLKAYLLRC
jgi:phosphoribosylaminoimidazole carboxylase (EC 4.1.1.21)